MGASQFFSNGTQNNPTANTVLATTGALSSGGVVGANYFVSLILTGNVDMTYDLQAVDNSSIVVETVPIATKALNTLPINLNATFFVPNGYSLQIVNETGVTGTLFGAIILKLDELVDA